MLGIELLPSLPRADEVSLACDCSQPLMALRAAQYRRRAEACLVMVGHNCGRVFGAWSSDYRPMALALKESKNSSRSPATSSRWALGNSTVKEYVALFVLI
jgi:hypothetical protein